MNYQMKINAIIKAIKFAPKADVMSGLHGTTKPWSVSLPLVRGGRLVLHEADSGPDAREWARTWEIREQAKAIVTALMPREEK